MFLSLVPLCYRYLHTPLILAVKSSGSHRNTQLDCVEAGILWEGKVIQTPHLLILILHFPCFFVSELSLISKGRQPGRTIVVLAWVCPVLTLIHTSASATSAPSLHLAGFIRAVLPARIH